MTRKELYAATIKGQSKLAALVPIELDTLMAIALYALNINSQVRLLTVRFIDASAEAKDDELDMRPRNSVESVFDWLLEELPIVSPPREVFEKVAARIKERAFSLCLGGRLGDVLAGTRRCGKRALQEAEDLFLETLRLCES